MARHRGPVAGLGAILDAILAAFFQPEGGDRGMWESTRVILA
jgi:hypothetical protein